MTTKNKVNASTPQSERSAARLGAVQALFQLELSDKPKPEMVVIEFEIYRLGKEIDGDLYSKADVKFFKNLVVEAFKIKEDLDDLISAHLTKGWSLKRLERIMVAILRAGTYELKFRPDIPIAVIVNEYVDITHAFFSNSEHKFVNGILDKLGKKIRG